MMQYYIVEIQQYSDDQFGHLVHYASDENADQARLKAESKYHEVLAAAAISNLPSHAAIMFNYEGYPIMYQCYKHIVPQSEENNLIDADIVEETTDEPENSIFGEEL